MAAELIFDGKKFISSGRASALVGYAPDYIGQLCRAGKLECKMVGRAWYVSEQSILAHKALCLNTDPRKALRLRSAEATKGKQPVKLPKCAKTSDVTETSDVEKLSGAAPLEITRPSVEEFFKQMEELRKEASSSSSLPSASSPTLSSGNEEKMEKSFPASDVAETSNEGRFEAARTVAAPDVSGTSGVLWKPVPISEKILARISGLPELAAPRRPLLSPLFVSKAGALLLSFALVFGAHALVASGAADRIASAARAGLAAARAFSPADLQRGLAELPQTLERELLGAPELLARTARDLRERSQIALLKLKVNGPEELSAALGGLLDSPALSPARAVIDPVAKGVYLTISGGIADTLAYLSSSYGKLASLWRVGSEKSFTTPNVRGTSGVGTTLAAATSTSNAPTLRAATTTRLVLRERTATFELPAAPSAAAPGTAPKPVVIERTERVIVGDISRAEVEQRLAAVQIQLASQISLAASEAREARASSAANATYINNVYTTVAGTNNLDRADDLKLGNPTVTGGNINGSIFSNVLGTFSSLSGTTLSLSGNIAVQGSKLYVDGTSGKVGVGTTSPAAQLSVSVADTAYNASTTLLTLDHYSTSAAPAAGLGGGILFRNMNSASSTENAASIVGLLSNTTSGSEAGQLVFYTRTGGAPLAERARIDNIGNVGVGTTSPWALLSVNPNGLSGPAFVVGSSSATNFIVTNAGRVGIGTTTPGATLAVSGNLLVSGDITSITAVVATSSITATNFVATDGAATTTLAGGLAVKTNGLLYDLSTNRVGVGTSSPWSLLSINPNALGSGVSEFAIGSSSASHLLLDGAGRFGVSTTSPWALLSVNPNGLSGPAFVVGSSSATNFVITQSGNVGLGTTSPSNLLSVHGGGYISSNLFVGGAITSTSTTASVFPYASTTALTISSTGAAGAFSVGSTSPWGYVSINPSGIGSSPAFVVGSSSATNFVITNGGNVGIATTSPSARFAFTGNAADATRAFVLADSGNIERLSILNNGNVGLGTTSPASVLSVHGPAYVSGAGFFGGALTATSTVYLATGGAFSLVGIATTSPWALLSVNPSGVTGPALVVGSSTATSFVVTNGGNIGIGTSSPLATLDMVQNRNGTTVIRAHRYTDTAPTGDFINFITAGGTSLFRVDNSGNVYQGGIISSGSISITSTSQPQLRVQYDSSDEVTTSVTSAGATSYGFNGTTPTASWAPQSNSVNTFSFTDAGSNSVLSLDTTNRRAGVGTTTPGAQLSVAGIYNQTAPVFLISTSTAGATSTALTMDANGNIALATTTIGSANFNLNGRLWVGGVIANNQDSGNNDTPLLIKGSNVSASRVLRMMTPDYNGNTSTGTLFLAGFGATSGNTYGRLDVITAGGTQNNGNLIVNQNGGNVGIGTTTPWGQLSASSTSAYPTFAVQQTGSGPAATFLGGNVGVGTTSPSALLSVHGGGYIGSSLFVGGAITATSTLTLSNLGLNMLLSSNGSGTLISTSTPTAAYYLATSSTASVFPYASTTAISVSSTGAAGAFSVGSTSPWGYVSINSSGIGSAPAFAVGSSTATNFVITNGGLLGIGSTTPATTLSVAGHGYFTGGVGVGVLNTTTNSFQVGQCVTGDTRLRRRRRRRRADGSFEDYFETVAVKDIQAGDEIQTLDQTTGRLKVSRVKQLAYMGRKPIVYLETASGKKIRTTANHPYLLAPKLPSLRAALFIDGANMEASMRRMNARIDYEALKKSFGAGYAGFYQASFAAAGQEKFFGRMKYLGYRLITKLVKVIRNGGEDERKANFDVEIATDASLHRDEYDVAVLLSGDSDFVYLAKRLQKYGKKIAVVAPYRATAKELRAQSDIYFNIADMPFVNFAATSDNTKGPKRGHHTRLSPALPILSQVAPYVNGGLWTKVSDLKEGMMIAVTGANGKPIFERIVKMEALAEEDVYDIEMEGTHNFVGNDIVAHNTAFLVNSSGNVGVGTTSPSALLSVHGGGYIGSSLFVGGAITATSTLTLSNLGLNMLLSSNGSGTLTATSTPTAAYYLATSSTASVFPYASTTAISSSGAGYLNNLAVGTYAAAGQTAAPSNGLIVSGNVGIGTTSPANLLSVHGGGYIGSSLFVGGAITATSTLALSEAARASGATPYLTLTGAADTGLTAGAEAPDVQFNLARTKTHSNGTISLQRDFLINAATHAFTNWAGGLITDLATLGITGAPLLGTNATSTNSHTLYLGASALNASTTNSYGLTVNANTGAANNYAAEFLGGSVGIGTTSPWGQFSINPNGITGPSFAIGSSTATNFIVTNGGSIGFGTSTVNNKFEFDTGTLTTGKYGLSLTGIMPNTTADEYGNYIRMTSTGASTGGQKALRVGLLSGYTGSGSTFALDSVNNASSTGNNPFSALGSIAVRGVSHPDQAIGGSGLHVGVDGSARWGSVNIGLMGFGTYTDGVSTLNGQTSIGVYGVAQNDADTSTQIGGFFSLYNGIQTYQSAGLLVDNGPAALPILVARDNGTEVLRIADGGNLGIGTTSPSQALSVQGNALISGNLTVAGITATSSTLTFSGLGKNMLLTTDGSGNILASSTPTAAYYLATSTTATSTFSGGFTAGNNAALTVTQIAPANSLYINSAGNVGIGTTNPGAPFEVNNNASVIAQFIRPASGPTVKIGADSTTNYAQISYNLGSGYASFGTAAQSNAINILNSSGNVGIGTTSPAALLSVAGSGYFTTSVGIGIANPSGFDLQIQPSTGAATVALGGSPSNNSSGKLKFINSNTQTNWQISTNDSIAGDFEFMPSTATGGSTFTTPTAIMKSGILGVNGGASIGASYYNTAPPSNGMIIQGNVGIGTTSPGTLLSVSGSAPILTLGDTQASSREFQIRNGAVAAGKLDIYDLGNAASRLTIDGSGNVGIGSTSPATALAVAGNGYFTGGLGVGVLNTVANTFQVGLCVTGDTLLRRRRKKRKGEKADESKGETEDADYIYDRVQIKDVKAGDEIQSLDAKTGQLVWSKVKQLAYMGKKPIFKLTTASGKTIRTTGNHPYLVRMGSPAAGTKQKNSDRSAEATLTAESISQAENGSNRAIAFIDASNIYFGAKSIGQALDFEKFYRYLRERYNVSRVFYYSGLHTRNLKQLKFYRVLERIGYELRLVPYKEFAAVGAGRKEAKADVDSRMTADMLALAGEYDQAIALTGDGDFYWAFRYLIESGKGIRLLAYSKRTARELLRLFKGSFIDMVSVHARISNMPAVRKTKATDSAKESVAGLIALLYSSLCELSMLTKEEGVDKRKIGRRQEEIRKLADEILYGTVKTEHMRLSDDASASADSKTAAPAPTPVRMYRADGRQAGGLWRKVTELAVGQDIAVASGDKAVWDTIVSIERLSAEDVYDIEVEGTHNFIGNDIVAHNTAFLVNSSGNVGIGSTSPSTLLSVHGGGYISSNLFVGGAITATSTLAVTGNITGAGGIAATIPYASTTAITSSGSAYLNNLAVGSYAAAGQTAAPANGLIVSGNVGIGTTSPTSKLSVVNGGADISGTTNASGYLLEVKGSAASGGFKPYGNNVEAVAYHGQMNALTIGSPYFGTIPPDGGAIFSGNVGIGTTSPVSVLSVNGASALAGAVSVGAGYGGTAPPSNGMIIQGNVGIGTTSPAALLAVAGNEYLTGNVGIGISSPSEALHINAATRSLIKLDRAGTNIGFIGEPDLFWPSGSSVPLNSEFGIMANTNLYLGSNANSNPAIFIKGSSGNVGIGTTTPDSILTIGNGNSSVTQGAASQRVVINTNGQSDLFVKDSSNGVNTRLTSYASGGEVGTVSNDTFDFVTNNTVRMLLDKSGNLGIGTTSPWRTLAVTGTVGFDGLTATSTAGDSLCLSNLKEVTLRSGNTCSAASSLRFKQNVASLGSSSGLSEVMALRPVSFYYRQGYLGSLSSSPNWNGQYVGLIAEEVQGVDPRLVTTDSQGLPDTVRYENLTAVLAKAVQEVGARVDLTRAPTTTPSISIDGVGNVGVGSTSPSYKLAVEGDVAATAFVNISTRTEKKDIAYVSEGERESFWSKLLNLKLATYHYIFEAASSSPRLGLIAEEAPAEVLASGGKGVDLYKLVSFVIAAVQEQGKRLAALEQGIVSDSFISQVAGKVRDLLASAGEWTLSKLSASFVVANRVEAQTLAARNGLELTDSATGALYCVRVTNGEIAKTAGACDGTGSRASGGSSASGSSSASSGLTGAADTTPPVITLVGNNPATIAIGASYVDPGATVTDNVSTNLGIKVKVTQTNADGSARVVADGIDVANISLDTASSTAYTITYRATDQAGNIGTAERKVIVGEGASAVATSSASAPAAAGGQETIANTATTTTATTTFSAATSTATTTTTTSSTGAQLTTATSTSTSTTTATTPTH